MEKKDERKPRLPAGTFAASDPPPAPRRSDPGVLADGVAHSSAPPAPPSGPHHGVPAIDRRRYTSTLTGAGGPPAEGAPPLVAPVLAPPKWRGAKAYLEGQEPKPRVSSIPTPVPVGEHIAEPEGGRQRVNTKLGPAPPPAPPPAPLIPNAEAAIDQAIERMLEGQAAVPMEVEPPELDDMDALEELPMEAATPLDEPSERAVPLARLALKPAPGRVPPAAPVDAPPRERSAATVPAAELAPVAAAPAPQPAATTAEQPAAPTFAFAEPDRAPEPKAERRPEVRAPGGEASPARAQDERPGAVGATARAPIAPAAVAAKPDQSMTWGVILLSLMVVVGAGGWLVTRGGFRRSVAPASAMAPATAAPVTEPLPTAVPPAPATSAPSESAPAASSTVASSALHAARETHAAHSRSSSSHPRETEPDPAPPAPAAPQEPVLRVSPQGAAPQAAAQPSETPTRREVLDALEPLRPAVERCARGQHGIAQLDITVVSSGAVTHAVVAGDFAGTPEGSCIALAARKAQFAPFQKPRFRVIFPFSL